MIFSYFQHFLGKNQVVKRMLLLKKLNLQYCYISQKFCPVKFSKIFEIIYVKAAKMSEMCFAKKKFWKIQQNLSNILVEEFISY